ncbi:MAG: hypothetical protein WAU86_16280, partial [Oricola sp.]
MSQVNYFIRPILALAIAVAAIQGVGSLVSLPGFAVTAAQAQEQRPRTLLDLLFRGRSQPAPQIQEVPQRTTKKPRAASSPPPEASAPPTPA